MTIDFTKCETFEAIKSALRDYNPKAIRPVIISDTNDISNNRKTAYFGSFIGTGVQVKDHLGNTISVIEHKTYLFTQILTPFTQFQGYEVSLKNLLNIISIVPTILGTTTFDPCTSDPRNYTQTYYLSGSNIQNLSASDVYIDEQRSNFLPVGAYNLNFNGQNVLINTDGNGNDIPVSCL